MLLVSLAPPASAQEESAPEVDVDIDPCVPVNPDAVRRIVHIELATSTSSGTSVTPVLVRCSNTHVVLHVTDPLTGKSLDREIDAAAFAGPSSSRLLALAIVELVSASWVELVVTPTPVVAASGPPAPPSARRDARERVEDRIHEVVHARPATRVRGDVALRASSAGPLVGGGVVFVRDAGLVRFRADVSAVAGSDARPLGHVNATLVDGAVALAIAPRFGAVSLYAGAGARFGSGWLVGVPLAGLPPGGVVVGLVGGPLACAGLSLDVRWLSVGLEVEGGWAVAGIRGFVDGADPVDLFGGWVGGAAEIGIAF